MKKNTVFIIGAGASAPYGYPTGNRLRNLICKNYSDRIYPFIERSKNSLSNNQIQRYKTKIKNLADVFFDSGTPSIDLFLSRNSSFSEIGKCIIVSLILEDESRSKFHEDIENTDLDWYSYLYLRMSRELTKQHDYKLFGDNKVSFITFNYDRSLEFFLAKCLKNSFFDELKDCNDMTELIPFDFLHVYGCVAELPWQSDGGLEYGIKNDFELISQLSKNIRVIYDRTDDSLDDAKKLIRHAKKIFFLGFGYAGENLKVLGFPHIVNSEQLLYGTAQGFTKRERDSKLALLNLKNDVIGDLSPDERASVKGNVQLVDTDCLGLLRSFM